MKFDEIVESIKSGWEPHDIPLPYERVVGWVFGVGPHVAKRLIAMGLVLPPTEVDKGLSKRAAHILLRLAINSKEEALVALKNGTLNPQNCPGGVRGYGAVTHKEVCAWAGIQEIKYGPERCPHCGQTIPRALRKPCAELKT